MTSHYLLWATGADQAGIVAAVARVLYEKGCNIEDSSMLRLGSEFAILLIFSSPRRYSPTEAARYFTKVAKKYSLALDVKTLSQKEAAFKTSSEDLFLVS